MARKGNYATREGVERGEVRWVAGDFFEEGKEGVLGEEKFGLIYDYTVSALSRIILNQKLDKLFVLDADRYSSYLLYLPS